MISTQKSRNKLLLQEEKVIHKTQILLWEIKFTFLPLFHCFLITQTQIEHKLNINLILKKKKKKRIHREYWIREEWGPWGCGWITLSRSIRWRERERKTVGLRGKLRWDWGKQRKKLFKQVDFYYYYETSYNWTYQQKSEKRWLICFVKKNEKINFF